jgi:hypothetical protein
MDYSLLPIIEVFAARGELRDGLDPSLALDLLFGINRADTSPD